MASSAAVAAWDPDLGVAAAVGAAAQVAPLWRNLPSRRSLSAVIGVN